MEKTNKPLLQTQNESDNSDSPPSDYQMGKQKTRRRLSDHPVSGPTQERGQNSQAKNVPDPSRDGEPIDQRSEKESKDVSSLAYFSQGETEMDVKSDASYCTIYFGPNQQGQALVDSGNLVATAISGEFARQLGISIQAYDDCPSAISPDGRTMEVIGQTGPLTFTFKGAPNTTFEANMAVIEGLSHQVNLGKAWLTENRAVHDHARETVKLKRPKHHGWTTIHLRGLREDPVEEKTRFVYGQMRTRIPARSARYVPVTIPALERDQDVVIIPAEGSHCPALVAKSLSAVTNKRSRVALFNPLDKDVYVEKWCKLGEAEEPGPEPVLGHMAPKHEHQLSAKEEKQRRQWLHKEFRLGESDLLSNDPKTTREVEDLLLDYFDVISISKTDYGQTQLMELEIDLVPGAKPYKGRCLPTNPREEEDFWCQLQEWNRQGVTEPANSPWGAPLIPVRKKDGRIRWCVDFRKLNECTVKDSYPLPLITTNLHKLGTSTIFSTIDGTGAYHNLPIAERDRPLTAFVSPFGQFQFKRMPFGLCNAPQAYSRLVEMILAGIDVRYVLAYIDDIIVHTKTKREHLEILRQVLEAHRKGGLKVAPAKSFLFRSKVEYLGHQVSKAGIEMVDSYVNLLLDWPKPTTPRELSTFLGKSGYYRQYIPGYGKLVSCLEQEKKKPSLTWTPQMDKAFDAVKDAFRLKPILAFPDYKGVQEGRPFIFDSDWCQEGMAQSISQVQPGPDGMRERVIAHGGRKCTVAERNYSSNKGETCSFIDGLQKFEHILRYAPFKARVDNRCLSYIRNLKKPTGIWIRWLELIESFQFDIEHRAGKKHANVDALSRAPHLPPPTEEMERISSEYLCALTGPQLDEVERLNQATLEELDETADKIEQFPLSNRQIRQAQRDDPDIRTMFNLVGTGVKPTKDERRRQSWEVQQMLQDFEMFYIHHGILYKEQMENEPRMGEQERLVLPKQLRKTAFYWAHADGYTAHMGINKTQGRMRMRFYFPGLYHYVERQVLGCHRCLQKKGLQPRANMTPRNTAKGYPGARWSLDLVGPLTETEKGNVYILTAEDVFTRYPIAVGIPDRTAETVAKAFEKEVISEHGSCSQLLTDNAQELTGHIIQDVAKILGITKVETVPYNPNANKIERFHRTLGDMLRSVVDENQKDWDDCLPACLLAYRTSVHSSTKCTPFFLTHGREAILPIDLIFPRPPQEYEVATIYGQEMADTLDKAFAFVRDKQDKVIKRQISMAADQFKDKPLEEGDLVWYYSPQQQTGKSKKLKRGWRGPFKVVQVVSEVTYIIQPTGNWTDRRPNIPVVIHRLQRYFPDTAIPSDRTEATEEELVQELVDAVDENLEATDAIQNDEGITNQQVKVAIPQDDEVDEMVDFVVTRRDKRGEGLVPGWEQNLHKDLMEYFGFDDEIMKEEMDTKNPATEQVMGLAKEPQDKVYGEGRDDVTSRQTDVQVSRATVDKERSTDGGEMARQRDQQTREVQVSGQGTTSSHKRPLELDDVEREQASRGSKEQVTDSRRRSARIQQGGAAVPFWTRGAVAPRQNTYETPSARNEAGDGRTGTRTVPAYMATGAQVTAAVPTERPKRAREDSTSVEDEQTAKQVKTTAGTFNAMTEAFGHLNVRNLRVKVDVPNNVRAVEVDEDEDPQTRQEVQVLQKTGSKKTTLMKREGNFHSGIIRLECNENGARMPRKGSTNAAGYDCFAARATRIARGSTVAVPLGFRISPSTGVYIRLAETSSWPCQRPMFLLRAGVVDPDYRGQVVALITYMGQEEFGYIDKHERVCQMVPTCFRGDPFHVCYELPGSGRGDRAGYTRFECNQTNCREMQRDEQSRGGDRRPTAARGQPDGVRTLQQAREEAWVRPTTVGTQTDYEVCQFTALNSPTEGGNEENRQQAREEDDTKWTPCPDSCGYCRDCDKKGIKPKQTGASQKAVDNESQPPRLPFGSMPEDHSGGSAPPL